MNNEGIGRRQMEVEEAKLTTWSTLNDHIFHTTHHFAAIQIGD